MVRKLASVEALPDARSRELLPGLDDGAETSTDDAGGEGEAEAEAEGPGEAEAKAEGRGHDVAEGSGG